MLNVWGLPQQSRQSYTRDPSIFWAALGLDQALSTLEKGTFSSPSIEAVASILFQCRKQRAKEHAVRLHAYMHKHNLEALSALGNHLVATLVDIGSIHDAQKVFDGLEYRNDMSWHALITGYVNHGRPLLAFLLYTKMQDVDRVNLSGRTFVALLKACLMLQDISKGIELHGEVARLGLLNRDLFVASTLVDFYIKCGSIYTATEVFDKLTHRDVVLWNALITGHVKYGFTEEALHCFYKMQFQGIHPNAVTFICILKACGMTRSIEKTLSLHSELERKGLLSDHLLTSTLVDTYAKCGCMVKAQAVFDALPVHNVVSWTALISGYADHDQGEEALAVYADMQAEGVLPNGVTYICLLKACGCLRAWQTGQELHCEISRMSPIESSLNVGNTLIDMYAKCGLLRAAHEVFDKLEQKDVISWNAILAGYAEEGLFAEAFDCFECMRQTHFCPNAVTFSCILKACASTELVSKGQQMHAEIQKKGLFRGEPVIGNALVDMYAKCGLLEEAEQVFDELLVPEIVSWNTLLVGYTEHQHGESALEWFEQMECAGISPDSVSFSCSLKACGSIGAREEGEQIHSKIEKMGFFDGNPMIGNALVDMYAKCGLLATSQHVFDKLSTRYAVAWNALMLGYADSGYGEKALELFEEMQLQNVPPDLVTFVCILKACGSVGAIKKGKELHAEFARQDLLELDLAIGNTLVDMYAKCNMLSAAQEAFESLPCRDTISWNVLLAGYTDQGHGNKALQQLKKMQLRSASPDDVTFVTCLKACSSIGAVYEGQDIHCEIEVKGFFDIVLVGSMLVDFYAKCGLLMDAQYSFDKLPVQDLCLWNVLIAGYTEFGQSGKALQCLERMQLKGVSPDAITYFYTSKACGSLGATTKGVELHVEVTKRGFLEVENVLGNTLIGMYVKCGVLVEAQSVFERLPYRDIGSWNALIAGYDELKDSDAVFLVFEKMLGDGVKPDVVTFILILNACSRRGLQEKAEQYFEAMTRDYGIDPSPQHHTCMVDLHGRIGELGKAMRSIRELSCPADLAMWHTVLGACERWGNVELGRQAFKYALSE